MLAKSSHSLNVPHCLLNCRFVNSLTSILLTHFQECDFLYLVNPRVLMQLRNPAVFGAAKQHFNYT